jgi:hypothetical protein
MVGAAQAPTLVLEPEVYEDIRQRITDEQESLEPLQGQFK